MTSTLLEVRNLKTFFYTDEGEAKAVDDVSFAIERGKAYVKAGDFLAIIDSAA